VTRMALVQGIQEKLKAEFPWVEKVIVVKPGP
jgi:Fe-S cluster biogenesis protein NfuA